MAKFAENTLADFTTRLPERLNLTGFREVALAEIAWPASIQNITSGQFKYRLAVVTALEETEDNESGSSHEVRKSKRRRKPYGMITMCVPPTLPIKQKIIEKVTNIEPGVCEYRPNYAFSLQKNLRRARPWPVSSRVETR